MERFEEFRGDGSEEGGGESVERSVPDDVDCAAQTNRGT